jgi:hypothetical protein
MYYHCGMLHTIFMQSANTHPLCTVRGKNETQVLGDWSFKHELFANFVPQSATKEIQIGIWVIAQSDESNILILHLWMRSSKDKSFKTADF